MNRAAWPEVDDFLLLVRQDYGQPGGHTLTASTSDLSLHGTGGLDAAMADDHMDHGSAVNEVEFAVGMTAMLRTAARAADELAASYRELARRFAEQVDAELASDVEPSALPIGQAFREVAQQGHAILATLYEHRTASDPSPAQQAVAGIELPATPSPLQTLPAAACLGA
jgi:hypothetical protein